MPARAVRPELPPQELRDRVEGWGLDGHIDQYSAYRDTGQWPETPDDLMPSVVMHSVYDPLEQPETSDGNWYRDGELI